MGNRAVLSNSSYVSIDVLAARMEQEDAQDCTQELITPSSDPISVSSMGGDEDPQSDGATGPAPQPQSEDVQWAIALALHALEVDTVKSGEDLSCCTHSVLYENEDHARQVNAAAMALQRHLAESERGAILINTCIFRLEPPAWEARYATVVHHAIYWE
ncbi:hypothetical protein ONZ51_g10602 [Trametes cubensis]|uniref:Uncharacterized protein n=1 Tax=Trametes cubensis TaxID=1111947 RepID=A0AAD7X4Q4_9APHY|nr:hypothetical protein ONZ51_g10602 [Trametes cubensis]